ncbi:MAG: mechanosensitive ion channel domain-containing protein [Candidatus Omnitrophota bacterium]
MKHKAERWTVLIFLMLTVCLNRSYAQDWRPVELIKMESKFQELGAQVATLNDYDPKKLPDFQQMEKINQLMEELDFNKRKFDLLIGQYNVLEDKMIPFLQSFYKKNPQLKNEILAKLTEYTGEKKNSILALQEQINTEALLIERLEKRIEFLQVSARDKALAEDMKQKTEPGKQTVDISKRLVQLAEDDKNLKIKLADEEKRYSELKQKEAKQSKKIEEKQKEINALQQKIARTTDEIFRLAYQTTAMVRQIRINGLEIPRLNSTKTFIYLSDTAIKTYKDQIESIKKEVASLKEQQKQEWIDKLIKALKIVAISLLLVFLLIRISKIFSKRLINRVQNSQKMDTQSKQRYNTLSAVIMSFVKVVIWVVTIIWALGELEINIGPLLVAAGGVSLAIGFGAQSLVKDVVSGFFILIEKQFSLGDFVDINGDSGYVEKISLRTIKIRALDGSLHIIHNGSITKVANKTYDWSRAVVNVKVSISEEPQKILSLLKSICEEIMADPLWSPKLIEEPIPQGIIGLGETAADFRILAKTIPDSQWAVERELRVRISSAFQKNAIETPSQTIRIDRNNIAN